MSTMNTDDLGSIRATPVAGSAARWSSVAWDEFDLFMVFSSHGHNVIAIDEQRGFCIGEIKGLRGHPAAVELSAAMSPILLPTHEWDGPHDATLVQS